MFKYWQLSCLQVLLFTSLISKGQPGSSGGSQGGNPFRGNAFALIIGVDQDSSKVFNKLDFATSDAKAFYEFLKSNYTPYRFNEKNTMMLEDKSARTSTIRNALYNWLEDIKEKIQEGDAIFIYWSGHGLVDSLDQKLICSNTWIEDLNLIELEETISMSEIKERIKWFTNKYGVKVFLIVDACRNRIVDGISTDAVSKNLRSTSGPGEYYLYACDIYMKSYECKNLEPGRGVFTYFLLLGLMGAGDNNGNNMVSFSELSAFLTRAVNGYVNKYKSKNEELQEYQFPDMGSRDASLEPRIMMSILPNTIAAIHRKKGREMLSVIESDNPVATTAIFTPRGIKSSITANNELASPVSNYPPLPNSVIAAVSTKDSTLKKLIARFNMLLATKQLVSPKNNCAYEAYLLIRNMAPDSKEEKDTRSALFVALLDNVKLLMDSYLSGQLMDIQKKTFELGYDQLQTVLKLAPEDSILAKIMKPKLIFLQSRALAGSHEPKDWNRGINIINSALNNAGIDASLYHTLGLLYAHKSRFFTAIKYFELAQKKAPKWKFALYSLAGCHLKIQEFEKSIQYCDQIIAIDSLYSLAYSLKGANFESIADYNPNQDYSEAIKWNKLALEKNPANADAYYNLGKIHSKILTDRLANINRSFDYFRLGAGYNDEHCFTRLGKNFFDLGYKHYDSAKYFYLQALRKNPFNATTLQYLALLLTRKQRDSLFFDALAKSQYDYKIYAAYKHSIFSESPSKADSMYNMILQLNDEDPSIYIIHSRQFQQIDSITKARDILLEGLVRIPQSPSLYLNLARLYMTNYKSVSISKAALENASLYLNKLKALYPNYSIVNYELSRLALIKGNIAESNSYRTMAFNNNKHVEYSSNSLTITTQEALKADSSKNHSRAQQHYKVLWDISNQKYSPTYKLARSYYSDQKLDSALFYYQLAGKYLEQEINTANSDSLLTELSILGSLIYLDHKEKSKIRYSIELASSLETQFPAHEEDYILAVAFYKLKKVKTAIRLATKNQPLTKEIVDKIVTQTTWYSPSFITLFKKLVREINPSL